MYLQARNYQPKKGYERTFVSWGDLPLQRHCHVFW
jgi:hypothetical protein